MNTTRGGDDYESVGDIDAIVRYILCIILMNVLAQT